MEQDQSSEKSEEPTKKKLDDARKKGQVAKSKELTSFFTLLVFFLYIAFAYKYILVDVIQIYSQVFVSANTKLQGEMAPSQLKALIETLLGSMVKIILIPTVLAAVISGFIAAMQVGGLQFSPEAMKLDIQKFNPVTNAKNIFSLKTLKKFAKDMIQLTVMFSVSYIIVKRDLTEILNSSYYNIWVVTGVFFVLFFKLLLTLLIIYLIFAVVDFFLEKRQFLEQMKMTKDELKKEFKETEISQEVKQRQREIHQEILEEEGVTNTVKNSTMVLTNPLHYAIVILYDPKTVKLPVILVKARAKSAEIVIRVARKHKVLIVRDIWLTRRLYVLGEVGKFVPSSMVGPVADIIGKNLHLLPEHIRQAFMEMGNIPKPPPTQM